jgi:hypothetical protein
MVAQLFKWSIDFTPDVSLNSSMVPFWSPEIYSAIVWDHALSFNSSVGMQLTVELAEITFLTLELEVVLLRAALGLQHFLMEEIPTHACFMGYSDVKLAEASVRVKTNTKNCTKNFLD